MTPETFLHSPACLFVGGNQATFRLDEGASEAEIHLPAVAGPMEKMYMGKVGRMSVKE